MSLSTQSAHGGEERYFAEANKYALPSALVLTRSKTFWEPAKLGGVLWRAVIHPLRFMQVRSLVQQPLLAEVAQVNPRFAYKYLTREYLLLGINTEARAASFLHHYKRLLAAIPEKPLRRMLLSDLPLFETAHDGRSVRITLGMSRPYDKEGELSLNLEVDREIVFRLSFTLVPGRVVRSRADEVLLITRLQGVKAAFPQIQLATRAMHQVAPRTILLAAAQGVAAAFGVSEVVAVNAARQSSYKPELTAIYTKAYDYFFTERGLCVAADGLYTGSMPIPARPLALIQPANRRRTRRKRAFRQHVQLACAGFLG